MQARRIPHTALPGGSRLFLDYLYGFPKVSRFYGHAPSGLESFQKAAAAVEYPAERRAALVEELRRQNGESAALEKLGRPGTLAVVTGQQVGLFSGPAYSVYKALMALRLAEDLTAAGMPSVAVFWLASEDHDWPEVNHCYVFDGEHRPRKLAVEGHAAPGAMVGGLAVEQPPLSELEQCLAGFPSGAEVCAWVGECYQPGKRMGEAFAGLLRKLLGGYGLLTLDPTGPAVRRLAAPMLERAAARPAELASLVLERNRQLVEAGYHAQVRVEKDSAFYFEVREGRRLAAVRLRNGVSGADLSPNALLRPVVQDWILPTIAYVGGPAEVAYLAQSQALYQALLGRMPVIVPRAFFTVLDAKAGKLMDRYGVGFAELAEGEEAFHRLVAARLAPPSVGRAFERTTAAVGQALDELRAELAGFDATLAAALDNSRAKILYQLAKNRGKAERESLRRDQRAARDARFLYTLVYPERRLQERFYSILPLLAKHGRGLLDELYRQARPENPDHVVIIL